MEWNGSQPLIKCSFYRIAKLLGLFKLSMKLTENNYRILCYHGGSIHDEHLFWPGVFIKKDVFEQHVQLINQYRFNVLSLNDVIIKAKQHKLPKRSLVLTFDDGFYSTKHILEPILKRSNFKATLYVTTYYVTHQRPIFNVALAYLFYKTEKKTFNITLFDEDSYTLTTKDSKSQYAMDLINNCAKNINEEKQNQLLKNIGSQLNINTALLFEERIFHNVNPEELKSLHEDGVFDIQLHTHHHNVPDDDSHIELEIKKNRKIISDITGKQEDTLVHFCYPSGVWNTKHLIMLNKLGMASATTLEPGLNTSDMDRLLLKRIVCNNAQPLILFEAELSGFKELLRHIGNTLLSPPKKLISLFKDSYGGRRGVFKYWFYKGVYAFKRSPSDVDWSKVNRLVFICTGNICRSPYAAAYSSQRLNMRSISYGLNVAHQSPAYATAIKVAKQRTIDLSAHVSTSISHYKYEDGDVLVVFEPYHLRQLKKLTMDLRAPVILLGHYYPETKVPYIHDPYGTGERYFKQCFSVIEQSIVQLQHLVGN